MKPISKQMMTLKLFGEKEQYMIQMLVSVTEADFDDTIVIKTSEPNEVGIVTFKLTNTKKESAHYKAYFKQGEVDLSLGAEKGVLEPYGRPGTPIQVKFTSNVYNRRVEDELRIETAEMMWRFRVKGMLSKPSPPLHQSLSPSKL